MASHRSVLLALSCLALTGCLEERLLVDVTTVIRSDGSCSRRVEYRLEHFDSAKAEAAPIAIEPEKDGLRLFHRFPAGEAWSVRDEPEARLHSVTAEGLLASPNAIGSDYWRALSRRAAPSQNHVSFALWKDDAGATYEYSETFLDPSSPLASLRLLSRLLLKQDGAFASAYARAMGGAAPPRAQAQRAYRERFAEPFAQAVGALAARPVFGPRERRETQDLLASLEADQKSLAEALAALSPGSDAEAVTKAVEAAGEGFSEPIEREMTAAGLSLSEFASPARRVRIRATLVMPGPIQRANTCVNGDTASWEFEGDDLYGRGFEMWAKAALP
ncbi:MAG: hypothetical protein ACHQKZ_01960 [Solirubrobacterales bacterium]|jgi:hypothetical protein